MKTLFILMNHTLSTEQENDAKVSLGVENFVTISDENWGKIDPALDSVTNGLKIYKDVLLKDAKKGDFLLVQGDFGATYTMVRYAKSIGLNPVYATTRRVASESIENGKTIIKREFVHERFREYEE